MTTQVVELISLKLSKKPLLLLELLLVPVLKEGNVGSFDCNIALDTLFELSIIIKINILIFIINSHINISI
jgi:hypothetical protein